MEISQGYFREIRRRGRRPNTERAYLCELEDFGEWLIEHRVGALEQLNRSHIETWQDDLLTRSAPKTQQVAATALRGVLKWAASEELGLATPNLWMRVITPRVPAGMPRPIPPADVEAIRQILNAAEPWSLWRLRTRALFFLIFSSGARISEALALSRGSVHEGMARVIQKGGRPHNLVISERAAHAIADYEAARIDNCPALFVSLDPARSGQPMNKREVQEGWDCLRIQLGIARFTTHQIRHACVSMMRRQGIDIVLIAKHVGHRNLQTILGYADIDLEDRRRAVERLD